MICVGMSCGMLLSGCPPPRRELLTVGCGESVWVVGGLLLCSVEFMLVGGLCEGTRSDGIGMACERTRCGRLV